MHPPAPAFAYLLKQIQPSLRHFTMFYQSPAFRTPLKDLQKSLSTMGIETQLEKLETVQDLPDRLRAIKDRTDALWISPDPPLINAQTVSILKEYSWANKVPFYAPTPGLIELGATAAISSNYREMGRAAARALERVRSNPSLREFYPDEVEIAINKTAAEKCGLSLSMEIMRKASKVIP
jgi:ABC-type uncharacterized transport system substrate-binding protein